MATAGKAYGRIDHIAIVHGTVMKQVGICLKAEPLRDLPDKKVVVGVFEGPGDLFVLMKRMFDGVLERDVAKLEIGGEASSATTVDIKGQIGRNLHCVLSHKFIRLMDIKPADAFD